MLSQEEFNRYSKQMALQEISLQGQDKLRQSKVLVVGAGGLGCPVLQYLTAAGIGYIGICDGDVVELSNIQRQILYGSDSIGKFKVDIALQVLQNLNRNTQFKTYCIFINAENASSIIEDYDIIIDATDNMESRYLLDDVCSQLHKPWIFGGIYRHEGQVSVFNFPVGEGPTYNSLYPLNKDATEVLDCNMAGVLGVLPGLIGIIQANECIKMVLGIGNVLAGKMMWINMLTLETRFFSFNRKTVL